MNHLYFFKTAKVLKAQIMLIVFVLICANSIQAQDVKVGNYTDQCSLSDFDAVPDPGIIRPSIEFAGTGNSQAQDDKINHYSGQCNFSDFDEVPDPGMIRQPVNKIVLKNSNQSSVSKENDSKTAKLVNGKKAALHSKGDAIDKQKKIKNDEASRIINSHSLISMADGYINQ
jgi:hypothetical protein